MAKLSEQKCVPCESGTPPLTTARVNALAKQINSAWVAVSATATDAMRIRRDFKFKDFKQAMAFVNRVAEIAEAEGHHPDLHIFYNKVTIELWTHAARSAGSRRVGGLSENDFILAAKIDTLS